MATWAPITGAVVQRVLASGLPASGYVIKLYAAGTSNNIPIATDTSGLTQANYAIYNATGDVTVSGNTIIPHANQEYKLCIYPSLAAANSDSGAVLSIDNIPAPGDGSFTLNDASNSSVSNVITITHSTTGVPANGIGTGLAFSTETSTPGVKTGAVLEAVATDVSVGSEDFDLVLRLMAGGAAAAEKFRFSSAGRFVTESITLDGSDVQSLLDAKVAGPADSVDSEIMLFSGVTGKTAKRATVTGLLKAASGVLGAAVSGADVKTINGNSVLGAGDLAISLSITPSARTSNTILASSDKAALIHVTSGTFTQTITAATTLGSGWFCFYENSGSGVVTLDPNDAETINGATTMLLAQGESALLVCDGTNFRAMRFSLLGSHIVTVHTGNGYGSTNTAIRRFTTTMTNTGTAITYADSATAGASFTINSDGVYEINYSDVGNNSGPYFGISVNSAQLTTGIQSIAIANRLVMTSVPIALALVPVTRIVRLAAGDVIRPHNGPVGAPDTTNYVCFSIRKIANV